MRTLLRSPLTYLAASIVLLAVAVGLTSFATVDNLGFGLAQIVPAVVIGILIFFAAVQAFKHLQIMSDASAPDYEAESAFDQMLKDPRAIAIYIGAAMISLAIIIGGGLS